MKAHQKVNNSIKEINRLMWEITKIVNQNLNLKLRWEFIMDNIGNPLKKDLEKFLKEC